MNIIIQPWQPIVVLLIPTCLFGWFLYKELLKPMRRLSIARIVWYIFGFSVSGGMTLLLSVITAVQIYLNTFQWV